MPKQTRPSDRAVDEQSRRAICEDLLTNILVEAGAGSGKTQMLAERMAAGVAAGVCQVQHMAAVTFTRKAASELRGRFHLALEAKLHAIKAGSSASGPPAISATEGASISRLEDAVTNLERFFAGTIHAFCARLLRERPVEAGVSPGFTELDEQEDLELRKRVWRDFVTNTRSAGDPEMLALLDADIRPKDLDSAFATLCVNEDVHFPGGDATAPDPKVGLKALDAFWKQLERELPTHIDAETTCKIQQAALKFRSQRHVERYRLHRPAVVAGLLSTWDGDWAIVQKWWADTPAEKKRLKELINPLHVAFRASAVTPWLSQWRQYVYRLSVALLTRARIHAAGERRRQNSLNYGDLLILTARVLRENEEVRRSLQGKYQHLFVDEFQDTDPVQAELIFLLASASVSSVADWRTIPLRPGALFVVGDPKQSIYRFRRADIDIYNIVRARFSEPATGLVLPLTRNFRSVPALCDWANDVFATRFPPEPSTHSPRFAALDPNEDAVLQARQTGGVFTLTHRSSGADLQADDAARIATYIRTEVDCGRRRYHDFLILTRKKNLRIAPYAEALEALNIPIEVSGAGAFGESEEVKTLTRLLRALSDPQDAVALVAVLRGPLFGISDRELFAYRQSGGWFNVFAGIDEPESDGPVRTALVAVRQFYRWTRILPAAAALDRILEHTGYLALAATTPGGVEAGDLLHAVDRARQVVERGGSLADAADALEDDGEEQNEVESLPLEPGREDVVRVMNLHKAKGLEATVVFLADPAGGFAPRVDVHIERTDLTAQGWFKLVRSSDTSWATTLLGEHADWAQHEAAEVPYVQAEEDRLLYVAATRAREMLVVSRSTAAMGRSPAWGVLNNFMAHGRELPVPNVAAAAASEPRECTPAACLHADATREASHQRVREPSWSATSATAEARHIVRMTRSADADADDPTSVVRTDTATHRADAGAAWGILIHGLLEHAMRHEAATREDLRRLAMWLTVEEPQLRTVIDEALDTVERAAKADFWQQAQSHEHLVEAPFVVGDGTRLTSGVIDLVYSAHSGWNVVDYKTDVELNEDAYLEQLAAYRGALRKLGCEVADTSVVAIRSKDLQEDSGTFDRGSQLKEHRMSRQR